MAAASAAVLRSIESLDESGHSTATEKSYAAVTQRLFQAWRSGSPWGPTGSGIWSIWQADLFLEGRPMGGTGSIARQWVIPQVHSNLRL